MNCTNNPIVFGFKLISRMMNWTECDGCKLCDARRHRLFIRYMNNRLRLYPVRVFHDTISNVRRSTKTHMRIIWNSNVRSFCSENVCVQLNQSHTFCHPYNTIHSMKMHCTVQSSQISRYAENTQNEQIHIWAWFYLIDAITRNSQLYHVHNKQINWAVSISNWIAYTK